MLSTFTKDGRSYNYEARLTRLGFLNLCKLQDEIEQPYLPGDALLFVMLRDGSGNKYESIEAATDSVDIADYGELIMAIRKSCGLTVEENEGGDLENPTPDTSG